MVFSIVSPSPFETKLRKAKIWAGVPIKAPPPVFLLLCLLDLSDLTAVIGPTGLAGAVGQVVRATIGALYYAGSFELPDRGSSLITSCSGYFSLRDCHGDTS